MQGFKSFKCGRQLIHWRFATSLRALQKVLWTLKKAKLREFNANSVRTELAQISRVRILGREVP